MKTRNSKKLNDFKKAEIVKNLKQIKGGIVGTDDIADA